MKFTTAAAIATGAVVVSAQLPALPSTIPILGLPFGQQCQQTVLGLFTNGSFSQCFPAPALLPLLTGGNDSIIPTLDNFMTELCYNEPCSNDTLTQAAQQIEQGCASDLQASNISNSVIDTIFSVYPVLREVLCLKTTDYYTEESYGGFLGPAPIPISDAYNLTDGAFCVSSVLTQLSAYVDANFTIPYITGAVTGSNSTAQDLFKEIQPNFICNGCIFGAVDVVAAAYPFIANVTVGEALAYANMTSLLQSSTIPANATLPDLMDGECAYVPLAVNTTQLPPGVSISIVNNTAPNAPADGEAIQDDTPTPSEPESPIPEGSAPAGAPDASAAPVAPAPVGPSASAPAAPSVTEAAGSATAALPSAASAAAPSLPAVDPSATPAAPSASA